MKKCKFFLSLFMKFILFLFIILIFLFVFLMVEMKRNHVITKTFYELESDKIGEDIKIAQISDYHDFNDAYLISSTIKEESPDIIVCTGDMFDGNRTNVSITLDLFKTLRENFDCPILYISGNHETYKKEEFAILLENIKELDIIYLENENKVIDIKENSINIASFDVKTKYNKNILSTIGNENLFNLFLVHQPEFLYELVNNEALYFGEELDYNMDLILTGHTHGGQFRFFGKGVYVPNQGWFPTFDGGFFDLNGDEKLIISRGIGNSGFPLRIFNDPEIVFVTLKKK